MALGIYDVVLLLPAKDEFIRTTVSATNNVRAYMKALKASKWADKNPDDVLYHTEKLSEFPSKDC